MTRTENDTTSPRVLRGGGWNGNAPSWLSAASRDSDEPEDRGSRFGFRTALAGRVKR